MMGNSVEPHYLSSMILSTIHGLSHLILTEALWGKHSWPHFTDEEMGKMKKFYR